MVQWLVLMQIVQWKSSTNVFFHQVAKLSGGENYAVLHSYSFVLGIRFSRIVRICHTIMSFGHI